MVLAVDQNGEISFHSTVTYPPDCLWLLEQARSVLLDMGGDLND